MKRAEGLVEKKEIVTFCAKTRLAESFLSVRATVWTRHIVGTSEVCGYMADVGMTG